MLRAVVGLALGAALVVAAVAQPPGGAQPKAKAKQKREPLVIPDVPRDQVVCFCLYTVHNKTLKLTAQLYPLKDGEERKVTPRASTAATGSSRAADAGRQPRRLDAPPSASRSGTTRSRAKYRVTHAGGTTLRGHHPQEPDRQGRDRRRQPVVQLQHRPRPAGRHRRQPQAPRTRTCSSSPATRATTTSEHYAAWLLFGRQFGEVIKDRPTVTIPDDHDVGHPNLWGDGGKQSHAAERRRRRVLHAGRVRQHGPAGADQPPARPVRPDAGAARHHRLLHAGSTSAGSTSPSSKTASGRPARSGWSRRWARGRTTSPTRSSTASRSTCRRRSCSASGS